MLEEREHILEKKVMENKSYTVRTLPNQRDAQVMRENAIRMKVVKRVVHYGDGKQRHMMRSTSKQVKLRLRRATIKESKGTRILNQVSKGMLTISEATRNAEVV